MAHMHSTHAPRENIFATFFDALFDGLAAIGEANGRINEVDRLNALSDESLSKMGLQRTDIVRYVFRDRFFI